MYRDKLWMKRSGQHGERRGMTGRIGQERTGLNRRWTRERQKWIMCGQDRVVSLVHDIY